MFTATLREIKFSLSLFAHLSSEETWQRKEWRVWCSRTSQEKASRQRTKATVWHVSTTHPRDMVSGGFVCRETYDVLSGTLDCTLVTPQLETRYQDNKFLVPSSFHLYPFSVLKSAGFHWQHLVICTGWIMDALADRCCTTLSNVLSRLSAEKMWD